MSRWLVPEELGHYEPLSRSLRIEGYSTSVRLERVFWDVLDQMAAAQRVSTCHLLGAIYREVHANGEPRTNFSSVLRVICLRHLECGTSALPLSHRPSRAALGNPDADGAPQRSGGRGATGTFAPDAPAALFPPRAPGTAR